MMQFGLVGIGAGAAAALLFASVASGSLLSVVLFYLAPLPVMIAGLGWGHWAALTAATVGTLAIAAAFGGVLCLTFVAGVGAPAWWLCYLTALARPVPAEAGATGQPSLEWYPPGRLVLWSAFSGALLAVVVSLAMAKFAFDAESFHTELAKAFTQLFGGLDAGGAATSSADKVNARFIDFLVTVVPPAAAVLATVTHLVNLWLAGRVVKFSSRLARPWPDIAAMSFPPLTAGALGVAIALSFSGGMLAILASIAAAALIMAFAVLGFAVLHAITRGQSSRPVLLGGIYASVLVFGWPVLMLALLGLIETFFGLRARVAARKGRSVV